MERTPHILVVDDDREIRDLLGRYLRGHGYRVTTAADGREMTSALGAGSVDLIVLDLMMPGDDGLTLTRNLRAARSRVPIIMLTAMGEETDRIVGLEMGADDYLAKPFNPRELLARIKAVLRRADALPATAQDARTAGLHAFAGWTLDTATRALIRDHGECVELSGGEYEVLLAFVTHPGRVLSRDQLLDLARGRDAQPFDRAMDVQVSRLRRKLGDDPKSPELIKTVRGGGYMFTAKVTSS
ncbi:MAG: response regulator [Alphaproteobacteria bacterium]|nr:response regulator [Alphaproteobacteria bacterium]MBF0251834.1 response regulator [Alphaproteobacteria bacterium]